MHFIDDKVNYIKEIYDSLPTGGMLILTDKTYNDMINIKLYHHYKKTMGVSDDEICAKAESVKDVMKINPPEWYLAELRSAGFDMVSIVDADYCFTSFLAVK
jgi:glycine cleavage system H lipoate-binding protein